MSRSTLLPTLMLLLVLANVTVSRSDVSHILDISQKDAKGAIAAAEASAQEVFVQIRAADREGGNVTALAGRFNEALEMLDKAKAFMDEGLNDQAITTAEGAQQLFDAIGHDATVLQIRAAAEASNKMMIILLVAPIVVISITLLSYFLIRLWRRRGLERIMEMEVKEAEAQ